MATVTYNDDEKKQIQTLKTIITLSANGFPITRMFGENAFNERLDALGQSFVERLDTGREAIEYINETHKMLEVYMKEENKNKRGEKELWGKAFAGLEEEKEEEEEVGYCGSCETELDYMRDGTDTNGHRCSDCYWAEEPQHRRVTVVEYIDKNK